MPDDFADKTESPTPRKRAEAREEGDVARSADFSAGLMLLGGVLLLGFFGQSMLRTLADLLRRLLVAEELAADPTRVESLFGLGAACLEAMAAVMAPLAIGLLILGLLSGVIQVGFLIASKPITPDFSRVSPFRGIQQLFSARSAIKLVMSLLKVGIVLVVAGISVYYDVPLIIHLLSLESQPILLGMAGVVYSLALRVAAALFILGVIDFAVQKWQKERDLRMTRHEIKEEFKRMEGDPLVKQRRNRIARQLALQRLASDVPKADLVLTNPTHYAIALRYDGATMNAPKVIAKGADHMALRIRQIAVAHGVPIVEKPQLARALYATAQVGQEISPDFYSAVAEILAYVYRLKGKNLERRTVGA